MWLFIQGCPWIPFLWSSGENSVWVGWVWVTPRNEKSGVSKFSSGGKHKSCGDEIGGGFHGENSQGEFWTSTGERQEVGTRSDPRADRNGNYSWNHCLLLHPSSWNGFPPALGLEIKTVLTLGPSPEPSLPHPFLSDLFSFSFAIHPLGEAPED